jgi:hypothetical protein
MGRGAAATKAIAAAAVTEPGPTPDEARVIEEPVAAMEAQREFFLFSGARHASLRGGALSRACPTLRAPSFMRPHARKDDKPGTVYAEQRYAVSSGAWKESRAAPRAPSGNENLVRSQTHSLSLNPSPTVEAHLASAVHAERDAHLAALEERKARLLSLPAEVRREWWWWRM